MIGSLVNVFTKALTYATVIDNLKQKSLLTYMSSVPVTMSTFSIWNK